MLLSYVWGSYRFSEDPRILNPMIVRTNGQFSLDLIIVLYYIAFNSFTFYFTTFGLFLIAKMPTNNK